MAEKMKTRSQTANMRERDIDDLRSQSSIISSASSAARLQARVDHAASKQALEYDQAIAQKQRELEEQKRASAEKERELTLLSSTKAAAVAETRLKIIDQIIMEENSGTRAHEDDFVRSESGRRTQSWVSSQSLLTIDEYGKPGGHLVSKTTPMYTGKYGTFVPSQNVSAEQPRSNAPTPISRPHPYSDAQTEVDDLHVPTNESERHGTTTNAGMQARATILPTGAEGLLPRHTHSTEPVERTASKLTHQARKSVQPSFTGTNGNMPLNDQLSKQLVRNSLPRCEPDVFSEDVTLYFPWKTSFKSMIEDGDISANQELIYLRNFTAGSARSLVDSFRRRLYANQNEALKVVWDALDRRFGNTAAIADAHLQQLEKASKFREQDTTKFQKFADVCANVNSQLRFLPGLGCVNFANMLQPIICNLPSFIQNKWDKIVADFAMKHNDAYPEFNHFEDLITNLATLKTHPNVQIHKSRSRRREYDYDDNDNIDDTRVFVSNATPSRNYANTRKYCPIHNADDHDLTTCKTFDEKTIEEKSEIVYQAGLCFLCLIDTGHISKNCTAKVNCETCGSRRHRTQFHMTKNANVQYSGRSRNGEDRSRPTRDREVHNTGANRDARNVRDGDARPSDVRNNCTAVCGDSIGGVSCSKIVLIELFREDRPTDRRKVYAILDDQSNTSLISPELLDDLGVYGREEKYFLSTCAGTKSTRFGRRVSGIVGQATNGREYALPSLLECDSIPRDKREVVTPTIVKQFEHLQDIVNEIPELDLNAQIMILIGRDAPELLKVRAFKNGPKGAPWAQKHLFGWTVSGQMCLDRIDGPVHVTAHKTNVGADNSHSYHYGVSACVNSISVSEVHSTTDDVFVSSIDDEEVSISQDDKRFLHIMDSQFHINDQGHCEIPLPLRSDETTLPNNKDQAMRRLHSLQRTFEKKPTLKEDYVTFMKEIFEQKHASVIPTDEINSDNCESGHAWYLPHFGVYHPKKPDKIRVVFDSACEYKGVSLNNALLGGPDQMNSLIGVLFRFRKDEIAIMCDIEKMFHGFHVTEKDRDYLRFLWFDQNDPSKDIIECRMNVHLFGNVCSPAIATYGLRRTADEGRAEFGEEAHRFVHRDFYVDDGLTSCKTADQATDLIHNTMKMLKQTNLRMHKVASNSVDVMNSLREEDRAKGIQEININQDALPSMRSLGVYWDLEKDVFRMKVNLPDKPYTRRGVLSVINSIYDPLGFVSPVTLRGKLLMQRLNSDNKVNDAKSHSWDDPMSANMRRDWQKWKNELTDLNEIHVPRCYHPPTFGNIARTELHSFSDASKDAIAVAVYIRLINEAGEVSVTLVFGQAKVAPSRITSIPRLELCAAVMSTQAVQKITKELPQKFDGIYFYTDSMIVLGYIQNESRRFYVYVANRVEKIRNISDASQWRYVDTHHNPADLATRGLPVRRLAKSMWLTGPSFLTESTSLYGKVVDSIPLGVDNPDVRRTVTVHATDVTRVTQLGVQRFTRFSTWRSARRAIATLKVKAKSVKEKIAARSLTVNDASGCTLASDKSTAPRKPSAAELLDAEQLIIRNSQEETVKEHMYNHSSSPTNPAKTKGSISKLDPFVDTDGILKVGGRLRQSALSAADKHPIILAKDAHVTKLIIDHYHKEVRHQGRVFTLGAIRTAGYWIVGGPGMVTQFIQACVTCRRLRSKPETQVMADLPPDRVDTAPPFTNVGFDMFGPWTTTAKRVRGGIVESKRWGLVFTCLSSRAIHIEVLESMDASAFICAIRRFFALRGPAKILRCDRGTNFVGAKNELDDELAKMNQPELIAYVTSQGCEWIFNPPHASHFGGVWERQIGTIRRILDSMLLELGGAQLTNELIVTLMAEVTGIINARPITALFPDRDEPQPLSPAMILTMKTRPIVPPPGTFERQDLYSRRRWKQIQYLSDQFWSRWKREYIQNLQVREKWTQAQRNMKIGDVVILKDDHAPRYDWTLGRITDVYASRDKKVRKVDVCVCKDSTKKTYTRPLSEIVLIMPIEEQSD